MGVLAGGTAKQGHVNQELWAWKVGDHPALQSHSAPKSVIVSKGIVMGEDGNTEDGPK